MGLLDMFFGDDEETTPFQEWFSTPHRDQMNRIIKRRFNQSQKSKRPFYTEDDVMRDVDLLKQGQLPPWM